MGSAWRRLLQELIDYAISIVGAYAWVDDILPKALPIHAIQRHRSEAHSKAIAKALFEKHAKARETRNKLRKARFLVEGVPGHQGY